MTRDEFDEISESLGAAISAGAFCGQHATYIEALLRELKPHMPLTEREWRAKRLEGLKCKNYPDCEECLCSRCWYRNSRPPLCCQPYLCTQKTNTCVSFREGIAYDKN